MVKNRCLFLTHPWDFAEVMQIPIHSQFAYEGKRKALQDMQHLVKDVLDQILLLIKFFRKKEHLPGQ